MNNKLQKLKLESNNLRKLLKEEKKYINDAQYLLSELSPTFDQIELMTAYSPLGRLYFIRFLMESDLSNNTELFNCYGRFANLVEGLEV